MGLLTVEVKRRFTQRDAEEYSSVLLGNFFGVIFGRRLQRIAEILAAPDQVTRSVNFENTRLFSKYYDIARKRKYGVIIVVSDAVPTERNWIITAYMYRKLLEEKLNGRETNL